MEKFKTIEQNKAEMQIGWSKDKDMKTIDKEKQKELLIEIMQEDEKDGLYTEKDLVSFGNVMYNKEKSIADGVSDADLQNFKEKMK